MKKYLNFSTKAIALSAAFIFACFINVNAQALSPNEKLVTNISEVANFVTFNQKTPVLVKGKVVSYTMTSGASKGHRRSGGCCQFNGGWCGRFGGEEMSVGLDGTILKSSIKMFKGTSKGKEYVRFEGLSDEDAKDDVVKDEKRN
jgi:hypothetical protein